ncbi:MAG TPA: pitrilysin family protein [Candidatus Nanoarchaeia archaeon]|nr:pitrilysin family protein [Candidatus Nanoarchaeia archaeon]
MKRLLLFLLLIGCSPLSQVDMPLTSVEQQPFITELPNGLTVTVKEMHALPLVTIQFWVHAGSKNEPAGNQGIAHVFEHIWFKGTATQPVGSFHKRVETLGGELNAMTAHDWTMYFVTVPSDKFNEIFPNMVDLLLHPAFDETEINKELQVIVEEQRMSFNQPERHLDDEFGLTLIDKHPYRNPIIGYKSTILNVTREELINFYNTWYVPNNMNIVIAGDVDAQTVVRTVDEAFANFQPKPLPALDLPQEIPRTEPVYNSSYRDIGFNYVAVGFLGPKSNDPDAYAMRVFNMIFGEAESSRLQEIVKKQKNLIVRGLSVFAPLNDLGVFESIIVVDPEKRNQATAELLVQLNRFKTEQVSDEELARAKRLIKAQRVKSKEEVFDVGNEIGQAWIDGTLEDYSNYMKNIDAVTKEDIQRVVNKYFTAYTMYELKPK